jgi:hypothetical protein
MGIPKSRTGPEVLFWEVSDGQSTGGTSGWRGPKQKTSLRCAWVDSVYSVFLNTGGDGPPGGCRSPVGSLDAGVAFPFGGLTARTTCAMPPLVVDPSN